MKFMLLECMEFVEPVLPNISIGIVTLPLVVSCLASILSLEHSEKHMVMSVDISPDQQSSSIQFVLWHLDLFSQLRYLHMSWPAPPRQSNIKNKLFPIELLNSSLFVRQNNFSRI